ncbi:hypothetical protein ACHAWO_012867 [Cyclotella atomus]|uniref:Cyclin N-terminal domain-containing protein n=1 Tax=Cyclotella atomus TaxID=382360 RepID=A0ABD3P7R6_9STRA
MSSQQGIRSNILLVEQLSTIFCQEESTTYKSFDYMNSTEILVSPSDRESLCLWGHSVVAACGGVDRSTVAVAISYFDRYLSSSDPSAKQALAHRFQFQLAFVACLVIALKVHSGFTVETSFISDEVCDGSYSAKEIVDMEDKILRALNWYLNGPTPHDFIGGFLEVVPSIKPRHIDFVRRFSKHIADLGMTNYYVAMQCPSKIAFTSICCALHHVYSVQQSTAVAIMQYLQVLTGLNPADQELQQLLETMFTLMQDHSRRSLAASHNTDESVSPHNSQLDV